MSVEVGMLAPDFTLKDQSNEDVSLSDFKGKNIILYFYPKDMTPGCTKQACDFRDNIDKFTDNQTVIIGVSADPVERHQKFVEKYDLPFRLLADVNHEVCEQYGVWKLKKMFGKEFYGIERSTFVIDHEGVIQKELRKVRVKNHVNEALEFIQEHLTK